MLQEVTFSIFQLYHQYLALWYTMIIILSALAGSFITMLCHRLPIMLEWQETSPQDSINPLSKTPHNINLFFPRSFCPNCKNTLTWWQNIPFFGYLLLRGKCAFCLHKIAPSYFLIEISSILLSLMTVLVIDHPIQALWWLIFIWISIALFVLDCKYLLLPDGLNYALLWSGLLFSIVNQNTQTAIISACVGYLSFFIINAIYQLIRKRDGIGQGDFKLLAGIAVWFSWYELPTIVLMSSILGLSYALYYFVKHKTINLGLTLPFAPFLLASSWLLILYRIPF